MVRTIDAAIADRAQRQFGLITVQQARELGLSDAMRRQRVGVGLLHPCGVRTLRVAGVPLSWPTELRAACFEAGAESAASHLSAGAWWGFRRLEPGPVEVMAALAASARRVEGVVHRSRHFPSAHVTEHRGMPVTIPERTLADLSSRLTYGLLENCVDDALRRGLVSVKTLADMVAELRQRGRKGIPRLARILDDSATEGATTSLERRFAALVQDSDLPMPELQARVEVRGRVFYLDGFFRRELVGVELDGHGTHATRRERQHDRERAAMIVEAGIRLLEFTTEDVWERPRYVLATIRRHLTLARAAA